MAGHLLHLAALAALALATQGLASVIDVQPMIVGGDTALPGQFPYQLAAGKVDLKHKEDGEQEVKVSKTIVHPNFKRGSKESWEFDLALLRTSSPFQYSSYVRPARLPSSKYYEADEGALLFTGWGVSSPGGWFGWGRSWPDKLQVTVLQTTPCSSGKGLCVAKDSASTPCEGDEGGALVQMLGDNTFTIVGMVTRVPTDCKNPREPSAAVSVFEETKFVQDTITSS